MAKKFTGIDIGSFSLRIVVLSSTGDELVVEKFIELPFDNMSQIETIKKVFEDNDLEKKNLCTGISAAKVFIRSTELPFSDRKKIEKALPFSLGDTLPFEFGDAAFAFSLSGESEGKTKVTSFVVKKENVHDMETIFRDSGLSPDIITAENGVLSFLIQKSEKADEQSVMIHLDDKNITINTIKDNKTVFSRSINRGINEVAKHLSRELNISELEGNDLLFSGNTKFDDKDIEKAEYIVKEFINDLIREIELSIRSSGTDLNAHDQILITGEGAFIKDISSYMEEKMNTIIKPVGLPDGTTAGSGIDKEALMGKGAMAFAYALMAAAGSDLNFIKARNPLLDAPIIKAMRPHKKLLALGGSILLLLYTLSLAVNVAVHKKRYNELKDNITSTFKKTMPHVKKIVNEEHQLKTALSDLENKMSILSDEGGARVVDIIKEVTSKSAESAVFKVTRMRIGEHDIKIEGETKNFDGVEKIKQSLKKSQIFSSVDVGGAKTSRLQNIVEFQLNIKLNQ